MSSPVVDLTSRVDVGNEELIPRPPSFSKTKRLSPTSDSACIMTYGDELLISRAAPGVAVPIPT